MFTVRVYLAVCAVILMLVPTQSFSQQPKRQAEVDFIQIKIKRFIDYQQDFLGFCESRRNDTTEYGIASDLNTVASQIYDYLDSTRTLLYIWDNLSCKPDREKVRWIILDQIRDYAKRIDISIKFVNSRLSFTRIPAMANSGTQMKEDLREIKTLFESIQFP